MMTRMILLFALCLGSACLGGPAAADSILRFANKSDLNALDPYTLNETFALGVLGNVMEGLTKRDESLHIVPGLAERWEMPEPTRWRFHLRQGVRFHDGSAFSADDVLFSADRARAQGSQIKSRLPPDAKLVKVDDYTVDFVLSKPNSTLIYEFDTWYMFSKTWAEANDAVNPQPANATALRPFALKANGTGPFILVSHEPGVKTVFRPNAEWWGKAEHNLTGAIFTTIASDTERVAALLSGQVDWIDPVPVEAMDRVAKDPNVQLMAAPELRTIMLMMDSFRDELKYASVREANPFKDRRVRQAVYQAIDMGRIRDQVMSGMAQPTPLLISPLLYARPVDFARYPYDPVAARQLLAAAGYPDGFGVSMDCPNDRYVNDAQICTEISRMLKNIGIAVELKIMPKAVFFEKVGPAGGYDTSLYLFGWTPPSLDSWNVLTNLASCRDKTPAGRAVNLRGYCSPAVDRVSEEIRVETDSDRRDRLIAEAFRVIHDDAGIIPLHQQMLGWGVSRRISVRQRADNQFLFNWVRKQ